MTHRYRSAVLPRLAVILLSFSSCLFAGNFATPVNYAVNPYPTGIVMGDFNRDGINDLAFTVCGDQNCLSTGSVQVLFGHGDGTFSLGGVYTAGPAGSTADTMASGDFNRDGTPDVVVVNNAINQFGNVSILLGDGKGGFLPPVTYNVEGSTPVWVAVGDFNGDHKLDLAVSVTTTDSVSILLGNGDGTFQAAVSYPVESAPQGITLGDVNSDGVLDIIAANQCGEDPTCRQGTVSVLLGNGNGTFQAPLSFAGGYSPLSVAVADFNGDGKLDVAVADACGVDPTCVSNGSVGILLGNGDGTLQAMSSYIATGSDTARLTVGDFNGDRSPDVVAMDARVNDFTVFLGKGDGTLQAGVHYVVGAVPIWAVVGDFNRDHSLDLAIADEIGYEVSVLLNSGGTRITLGSNPNPSRAHHSVMFNAMIRPSLPGFGVPTGSVTFTAGGKVLGIAPLRSGLAKFSTSALPPGRHSIQANYSGDAQYNSNFSAPLVQIVMP